jgi:uncharacterized membrane protein
MTAWRAGVIVAGESRTMRKEEGRMAVGPVQLIVLGFANPDFKGEVIAELNRLRELDTIKVIDALAIYKDAQGDVATVKLSTLTDDDRVELGAKIGALVGIGAFSDQEQVEEMALAGAEAAAGGIDVFDEAKAWDVVEEIPRDSAAVMLLIEHHWAVPLRDAVVRAGGFGVGDTFIRPIDLVAIGAMTAEEARQHEPATTS